MSVKNGQPDNHPSLFFSFRGFVRVYALKYFLTGVSLCFKVTLLCKVEAPGFWL